MKNLFKLTPLLFLGFFYPIMASAISPATCIGRNGLLNIICRLHELLNSIIPVIVVLGVVYFVWGVVNYVIADGEEAKKKGKDRIIYGIIGFTVISGLWGLVTILASTFGLIGFPAPSLKSVVDTTGDSCTGSLGASPLFGDLLDFITCNISTYVIPLIFALTTASFVWGVVQFVINSDEEAKKAKGKQFMIWGIVALTVMVSVWALVTILGSTFGIDTSVLPSVKPKP